MDAMSLGELVPGILLIDVSRPAIVIQHDQCAGRQSGPEVLARRHFWRDAVHVDTHEGDLIGRASERVRNRAANDLYLVSELREGLTDLLVARFVRLFV